MIPCISGRRPFAASQRPLSFATLHTLADGQGDRLDGKALALPAPRQQSWWRLCLGCLDRRRVHPLPDDEAGRVQGVRRDLLVGVRARLTQEYGETGLTAALAEAPRATASDVRQLLDVTRRQSVDRLDTTRVMKLVEASARVLHQRLHAAQAVVDSDRYLQIPASEVEPYAYGLITRRMDRAVANREFPASAMQENHGVIELVPEVRAAVLAAFREGVDRVLSYRTAIHAGQLRAIAEGVIGRVGSGETVRPVESKGSDPHAGPGSPRRAWT